VPRSGDKMDKWRSAPINALRAMKVCYLRYSFIFFIHFIGAERHLSLRSSYFIGAERPGSKLERIFEISKNISTVSNKLYLVEKNNILCYARYQKIFIYLHHQIM
jgi:hypothetical protein